MLEEPGISIAANHSIKAVADGIGRPITEMLEAFDAIRRKHDFEFWCATVGTIKDKEGRTIPFILNRPQRLLVARMEAQRMRGEPVRELVLKHRQWGCTTVSYSYVAWHQMELYTGRDAWFVGLDKTGAEDVRSRYDMIRQSTGFTMKNYDRSGNTKLIEERDALVSVGTVNEPNAPSGRPAQFVHLFEVGKWPSNPRVSAEKVAQNMGAMLVDKPGTVAIMESSAQASVGTYFKTICDEAMLGGSAYDFLFVSWVDDPQYAMPLKESVKKFVASWADSRPGLQYCRQLWDQGATLEQINWYINQSRKPEYIDLWRLKEEFPSTAREAFQGGGKRVFPDPYVMNARRSCKEPMARGTLTAKARTGREALMDIRLESDPGGPLRVWRKPDDNYGGLLSARVRNRFVIAADIGPGQWEGADYNCAVVIDRAPLLFGGMPEIAAEWHGHLDKDRFAWECARLGTWYQDARLAIEVNSLLEDNQTRYDPSLTVLDEIIPYYRNLYVREVYDNVEQKMTQKVGFHMNAQTKDDVISHLKRYLREAYEATQGAETNEGYIERCKEACAELDIYMIHDDGSMGSTSRSQRSDTKKKDDRVVARAIAVWLHAHVQGPRYVERQRAAGAIGGMVTGL